MPRTAKEPSPVPSIMGPASPAKNVNPFLRKTPTINVHFAKEAAINLIYTMSSTVTNGYVEHTFLRVRILRRRPLGCLVVRNRKSLSMS
jgi:hypothetical protein